MTEIIEDPSGATGAGATGPTGATGAGATGPSGATGSTGPESKIDEEDFEPEERNKTKEEEKKTSGNAEEDEIAPEDKETIGKVVEEKLKAYSSMKDDIQKVKDQVEVDAFIQLKPEYTKYRGVALKYMSSTAYSTIPVKNIMAIVAANDQQKIGAEKERDAQKKVREKKGGGSSVRKPGTAFDWGKASPQEFQEQRAKVLGNQG